jgi:hypothetical protein
MVSGKQSFPLTDHNYDKVSFRHDHYLTHSDFVDPNPRHNRSQGFARTIGKLQHRIFNQKIKEPVCFRDREDIASQ